VHLNFHLLLRRNAVEAAATCVTLHVNDAEAVACVAAQTLECREGAFDDFGLEGLSFLAQVFFFLAGFIHNFVEFVFLLVEYVFLVGEAFFGVADVGRLVVNRAVVVVDMLFGKFNFQGLEFDFFRKEVEFAVVANVVDLLFVAGDEALAILDFFLFYCEIAFELVDVVVVVVHAGMQTGDAVFKVFYFEGKFTG